MNKKKILIYFLFYVFTIVSSILAVVLYIKYYPIESRVITETVNKTIVSESGIEEAINNVYEAVVTVRSYYNGELAGTGSGFVYKTDDKYGYLITNNHVIENCNSFDVLLNGNPVEAKLLGSDKYSDLAVLSIDNNKVIKVAKIGDSDLVKLGNTVFTVGSPMGSDYSGSVTRGIISGTNRMIDSDDVITNVIQTDAPINPGNSGGPLVNMAGEVIGITSMKLADSSIEGMGFAIPMNDAMVYVQSLEKGENIKRPYVGVSLESINNRYALYYYGIKLDPSIKNGVIIMRVYKNTSADKAGLQVGDVITKVNDNDIDSVSKFRYYLYKYNVGETVKITYIRSGKSYTTDVVLMSD